MGIDDLRIDNLINRIAGNSTRLRKVDLSVMKDFIETGDGEMFHNIRYAGIPITHSWLKNMGFEKYNGGVIDKISTHQLIIKANFPINYPPFMDIFFYYNSNLKKIEVDINDEYCIRDDIYFVHQFQNVYKEIIGKFPKINIPK